MRDPISCPTYRQLCGKLWIPSMSLNREHRVPPTTRVQYADLRADPCRAAEQALQRLAAIRSEVWGKPPQSAGGLSGVVKLGFSWQGDDVLPFKGAEGLEEVMVRLFEQQHSEQLVCLVQEMVPEVLCEYRVLCFHDACSGNYKRERLWLKLKDKGEHHIHKGAAEVEDFALASAHVLSREDALRRFFGGDRRVQDMVEAAAGRLVDRWLLWFAAESADLPPMTRLDFLVSGRRDDEGCPEVWTCEVGECGASLCSVECDARNAAVMNWAVRDDLSGRFPAPLPVMRRNNGWKS